MELASQSRARSRAHPDEELGAQMATGLDVSNCVG